MKIIKSVLASLVMLMILPSCSKYLDVVPDNTLKLENLFDLRERAWDALAKVYSYIPHDDNTHTTTWTLGDEWIGRIDLNDVEGNLRAIRIMRGLQSATSPQLGLWSGTNGGQNLYQGIRQADVFLANIDKVRDMTEQEKKDWKAQVKFLKGYYAFLLIQKYGPIVLPEDMITPESSSEQLFLARSKVEDCFTYVIKLMDEAIPDLTERALATNAGQVDQIAAKAMKAKVLFFRASPFFNGNQEYFGDFKDKEGQPYFPQTYDKEKWKAALDAINEAVLTCERNGIRLYKFDREPYSYDRAAFAANRQNMQTLYDLRMVICDPWNSEVVWGYSNLNYYNEGELAHSTNIRLPAGYGDGVINTASFSWQWMGATYQMAERYYTKNGLPLNEDLTFNMNTKHQIIRTPGVTDAAFAELNGIVQPGAETINLYMNREPRFYANLGISGGFWRGHGVRINTTMFAGGDGGYNSSQHATDFIATGIGIQKFVHPESQSGAWQRTIKFPYPIMRMSDLYLMKAEVLNEYMDGPSAEVYELVNKIRRRAGIPDVDLVWSNPTLARTVNKHRTKEGMRDIILEERGVELAFEGNRYWDMLRHKRAVSEFSSPIFGWTHTGTTAQSFFVLEPKQTRRFTINDCLWPIDLNELNTNGKLVQNPGWQ